MVGGASRGGGRGRGRPPNATRGGGHGRRKSSANRGTGRGRGRPPSATRGAGRGRGRPPSAIRGGHARGRPKSATQGGDHGRGISSSATRGGGRGRGISSSATQGGGRGRGRPPSATREGSGRGRGQPTSPTRGGRGRGRPTSPTRGGRDRGRPTSAIRGGGRGHGRPLKKTVKKKIPVKLSKSKSSAINASEKAVLGKRKSAVKNPLLNVARQEDRNSKNKPLSKKSKLQLTSPVASSCLSQNRKVSAKVGEDTSQVPEVQDVSNNNTMAPILNSASQVDDIVTAKVFKASTIHGRKKSPYVCPTCSKHIYRKDHFLTHNIAHTKQRLCNVKPKRQHLKKSVSVALSDPVSLVGPSSPKKGNLPDNEKDQVDATSEREYVPHGDNVAILYDKTDMGTKNKLDTTIDLSSDEDMSTTNTPEESDLITSSTFLVTSDTLSASKTITQRTNPSFGVQMVTVSVMDNTICVSDDEEPSNPKELKCTKKFVKKRHFPHQPLRQNQIPNGGFENNPRPINQDLPILNMAKDSGVNSRSSCGEALDKLKLLGPSVTLTRAAPSAEQTVNL